MMAERSGELYALWANFWQALSHPIRLRVLELLRDEGPLNVGQLVDRLAIGQGHLSNHLACLKTCGLVTTQAQGRFVFYALADSRVSQLLACGTAIFEDHWAGVATCAVVSADPAQPSESTRSQDKRMLSNVVGAERGAERNGGMIDG